MSIFTVLVVLAVLVGLAILMGKYLNNRHKDYPEFDESVITQALDHATGRQLSTLQEQETAAIDHLLDGGTIRIVGQKKSRRMKLDWKSADAPYYTSTSVYPILQRNKVGLGQIMRIETV